MNFSWEEKFNQQVQLTNKLEQDVEHYRSQMLKRNARIEELEKHIEGDKNIMEAAFDALQRCRDDDAESLLARTLGMDLVQLRPGWMEWRYPDGTAR